MVEKIEYRLDALNTVRNDDHSKSKVKDVCLSRDEGHFKQTISEP